LSDEEKKKLGEAWFMSGEAHRALKHGQAALAAYQLCIAYASPFAYPARYQLALAEIDRGRLQVAEEALEQLLKLLGPAADDETYEKTLFTLGELHYRRGNWAAAERRLQEALERYPANPSAMQARSRLAQSCCELAKEASKHGVGESTPQTQSHYLALRRKWLEVAAVNFQKLADELAARQVKEPLSKDEEAMLRQAAFGAADCRFDLLQFEEAIRLYDALSERYRLRVEGLVALRNLWRCFWVKAPTAERDRSTYEAAAQAAYAKIAATLKEMPNSAFDNSAADRTRQYWEDWLANRK
ncbi:MAG TPA: tetratricopeptide repeat protein, partial [Gemmataceae bacterium]|nr:tetratricopeptide repeat protein [Gemmataceae bacterium]